MKKQLRITLGIILSVMLLAAFAGCGESGEEAAAPPAPGEEAAAALDTTLAALKTADLDAINSVSGGEDIIKGAESFGSEEDVNEVLYAMFGHFEYELGTPEEVDESHVNIPATVSNANMSKAVATWYEDLMSYAFTNPELADDKDALEAKTIETLKSAVDKTAEEEDGILTTEVTFPMVLEDGQWVIGDVEDDVLDAILGGFMSALEEIESDTTQ